MHLDLLGKVRRLLDRERKYHPLTIPQTYYLMVKAGLASRSMNGLADVSALLTAGLLKGQLPVTALESAAPAVVAGGAWENVDEFIRAELADFLWGYRRYLMQGQARYVEVWLEEPSLAPSISSVALDYCISTVVCPKTPSVSFFSALRRRLEDLWQPKPEVVVLYLGDYDPVHGDALTDLQETLRSEGGFWDVTLKRVALTRDIVIDKELPCRPEQAPRRGELEVQVPEPGTVLVELEALPPRNLHAILRKSIEAELDMELVKNQKAIQTREQAVLTRLRADILREIDYLLKRR